MHPTIRTGLAGPLTGALASTLALTLALTLATPALAAGDAGSEARVLVESVTPGEDGESMQVRILAFNPASAGQASVPAQVPATLTLDGVNRAVMLDCAPDAQPSASKTSPIAPGRFALAACTLRLPAGTGQTAQAQLALAGAAPATMFAIPAASTRAQAEVELAETMLESPTPERRPLVASDVPAARPESGNAYLGNLSAYNPIFGVYGPDTNSEALIQLSFKYQLFGDAGNVGGAAPLINGIHFGYTQRMFWDLGSESSPFRNIDFMPELFFLQPAVKVGDGIALGGQVGVRHESNGRDGDASRSANTLYIQPVATMPAGDYTVSIGPRLFYYIGDLEDNPDIRHYRGSTGLFFEVGKDDGLRLTTQSRLNFSSGKGAVEAELSYPFDKIVDTSLNLYVFGQAFAGYGENLLDYNRHTTRLRVGFAIVR
ncbi:phospholipase A [Novosphingobium sp. YJ-S2-02]|uniref:Phospholipase A1 n=1 Tax=Novosphingobium aureum TaxID=2792964 RepID=A0A931MLZ2_9SPHN|nr:phospholipase A [Novosphingobium aureum]MBH0114592.1 phospholipase A [Novosphingobium aureum]